MTTTPEWHYAPAGSFWLVNGRRTSGSTFHACIAHTLDTADHPQNHFQLCMVSGSRDADIITAEEITEAVPLVLVRKDHLDQLNRWSHWSSEPF